jgi:hypothetical protein
MNRKISFAALPIFALGLAVSEAPAQDSDYSKGQGYVYFAPGLSTEWENAPTVHVGAGGEAFFTKYVGVGAEGGYLGQFEDYSNIGTFSFDLVARLRPKTSRTKLEPFVTGGYTHFFHSGTANGINFGGGLNYWFSRHVGLRFEIRDHARGSHTLRHFIGFRIGVTFG